MHFFIVPTFNCNLSCSYCFEGEDRKNIPCANSILNVYDPRVKEDFLKYFEYCKNHDYDDSSISFHGGEATLLPAKDFLFLCHLWKDCYKQVFNKEIKVLYANMITNAVRFIREPKYLEEITSDPEINLSLGISFDMYSQCQRSPETYTDYENLFKLLNTNRYKEKVMFGLLTQISKHSIDNREEWLKYYEYFNNNFYDYVDNVRLKLIDDYSFFDNIKKSYLSDKKTYKFLNDIRKLQNKIILDTGKVIPTGYLERYLDLDEHICFGTCSNDMNLCWSFDQNNANMFHYFNYKFVFGCPRLAHIENEMFFNDFEEGVKKTTEFFSKKYMEYQNKKCKGCKYKTVCQPCPILMYDDRMYFNSNKCKLFMKRILNK